MTERKLKFPKGSFIIDQNKNLTSITDTIGAESFSERKVPPSLRALSTVIHHVIKRMDDSYKDCSPWSSTWLYFFTITPKGKTRSFADYEEHVHRTMWALPPFNFAYYIKEDQNTDHMHGVISVKSKDYAFRKMSSPAFVFLAHPVVSLRAASKYMAKHDPATLCYVNRIKYMTNLHTKDEHLKVKKIFRELDVNEIQFNNLV